MLKYVTPSWGNPNLYSKTLDISGKLGARMNKGWKKESFISFKKRKKESLLFLSPYSPEIFSVLE